MKARFLALVVVVTLAPLCVLAQAQKAQAPAGPHASFKDVYCSGFISSAPLEEWLTIIAAEDAIGRIMYSAGEYVTLGYGANAELTAGEEYLIVRRAKDPSKVKSFRRQNSLISSMGTLYQDVGRVRVHVVYDTTATAQIVQACDPPQNGDFLVAFEERPMPEFKLGGAFDRFAPFRGGDLGWVVAARDFPAMMGAGDSIYISLGSDNGLDVGDYVHIFRYGTRPEFEGAKRGAKGAVRGYRGQGVSFRPTHRADVPAEVLGEAMVIWVDSASATALVTHSVGEIHLGDFVEMEPPPPPTTTLAVEPSSILRGESAVLTWSTEHASGQELAPFGPVESGGAYTVDPTETTTYRLTVSGPGGSSEAETTLTVTEPAAPPPPTATLTVEPTSIAGGETAVLSWSIQNSTEQELEPFGPVEAEGAYTVDPTETTTYKLTARGPGGSIDIEVALAVTEPAAPPPPTAAVTVEPTSIVRGDTAALSWSSQNATEVRISPKIGVVDAEGSLQVDPRKTTTYRLTASGPGGSVETEVTLEVLKSAPPVAPTATLTVEPAAIVRGQSAVLSWSAQNATEQELEPFGPVEAEGAYTVDPTETTTYKLTAGGPGGSIDIEVTLTVTEAPPPPPAPIATLTVEPTSIVRGQTAVLSWSAQNATEVKISPEAETVESQGTLQVSPTQTTTYRLTATGPGGSIDVEVTLTVTEPPPPAGVDKR